MRNPRSVNNDVCSVHEGGETSPEADILERRRSRVGHRGVRPQMDLDCRCCRVSADDGLSSQLTRDAVLEV